MSKENRVEFYYLPQFYIQKSNGGIAFLQDAESHLAVGYGDLAPFMDANKIIVIRPANKKELKKADQELLDLLKKGEVK